MSVVKKKSEVPNELDAILDQALDDFEEQELKDKAAVLQHGEDEAEEERRRQDRETENEAKLKSLLVNMEDPKFGQTLGNTMKDLSGTTGGNETVDTMFQSMAEQYETDHRVSYMPKDENDEAGMDTADRQVAAAMQMMGQAQQGMQGLNVNKMEETGETMMDEMMQQFEALGEKEDYNVSKSLLSIGAGHAYRIVCFRWPFSLYCRR